MEGSIVLMILLQVFLIGLNAVFACAEIAVLSMNENKLAKMAADGNKRAAKLSKLTSQPARFLATIQVAITLSGFLGSAFAAENFSDIIVDAILSTGIGIPQRTLDKVVVILITIVLSYFTLVFGELVPKRVAMRESEKMALAMAGLLNGISHFCAPLVFLLTNSTNLILKLMGIDPNAEDSEVSEEEIRMMVDVGSEKGAIDNHEKEFIQNVFEFDDITAGDIITHRTELTLLFIEDSMDEWEKTICESRHTLYPVCDDSSDDVIGILNAKDYLRLKNRSRESVMKNAVSPAYFVPENVKADVLFRNMKNNHHKMAVVLDEYGGLCGVVTLNDLIEQLVGDLGDPEDPEDRNEDYIVPVLPDSWQVCGRTTLKCISKTLGIELEDEEHETFNGYVFSILEAVPQDGTTVEVETDRLKIRVTSILDHQIHTAIIQLKEEEKPADTDRPKEE